MSEKNNIIDFNDIKESKIKNKNKNSKSYNTVNSHNTTNINISNYNFTHLEDPVKNSSNRTKLKDRVGKQVKLWAYAIDEYKNFINDGFVRYTVINVHDGEEYIADHLQIDIPHELYDKNIRHNIIWFRGIVKSYAEGSKQSVYVNKLNLSDSNNLILNSDYIKNISTINYNDIISQRNECRKYKSEEKIDLLQKYINELNHLINNMPRNFISNYIINQYTINYDPDSVNRSDLYMIRNDDNSIMEILILVLSIIKKLSTGEFKDTYSIFRYINWILNSMQGFDNQEEFLTKGYCKIYKDSKLRKKLPKQFINFCDDHKLYIRSSYEYVLTRNVNYDCSVLNKDDAYMNAFMVLYSDSIDEVDEENEMNKVE